MTNILWTFQHHLTGIRHEFLLALGLFTIAAGLFVWLGGLGFRKILLAVIGGFFGGAFILYGKCPNTLLCIAAIGIGISIALALRDNFLVLLASVLATMYGYSNLIRPYVDTSAEPVIMVREFVIGIPFYHWPILLAIIVVPFAARATWYRETPAVLYSIAGAILFFAGAVMLYVCSGIAAIESICSRREVYIGVFVLIAAIGAVSQIWLLPRISSRFSFAQKDMMTRTKRTKKSKTEPTSSSVSWRTS